MKRIPLPPPSDPTSRTQQASPSQLGRQRSTRWGVVGALVAAAALSACASVPNPTAEMATARAAVDSARRAGAGQSAAADMGEAEKRLTAAERAQASRDYVTARRSAELASATALLAEEKGRLARANQAKSELDSALEAIRMQADPSQVRPPQASPTPTNPGQVRPVQANPGRSP